MAKSFTEPCEYHIRISPPIKWGFFFSKFRNREKKSKSVDPLTPLTLIYDSMTVSRFLDSFVIRAREAPWTQFHYDYNASLACPVLWFSVIGEVLHGFAFPQGLKNNQNGGRWWLQLAVAGGEKIIQRLCCVYGSLLGSGFVLFL